VPDLAATMRDHPASVGTRLLVLHGSRARGDHSPTSDWDVGYLSDDARFDPAPLALAIADAVGSDAVDVVDLATGSALLRFRAAPGSGRPGGVAVTPRGRSR